MLPVIALVGAPNVGKSTMFNRLTKTKDALVFDRPGVTRDRQYGEAIINDRAFIVIDTGGIGEDENSMDALVKKQTHLAIQEADVLLFMVDARLGLTAADREIAGSLRKISKPILIGVNKCDGVDTSTVLGDFYSLGLKNVAAMSASSGHGVKSLLDQLSLLLPPTIYGMNENDDPRQIRMAIIGKPNVGKSTLTNRMLGEERVICFDEPGTTRDSIFIPFERRDQHYMLIDTAGIRRKKNISEALEKFSIIKSLKAIESAHVVIFVIDATEGLTDQDLKLLGFVIDTGKALVIAINKWDGLDPEKRTLIQDMLDTRGDFLDFAKRHYISALHGTGVGNLFDSVNEAYESANQKISTPEVTRLLEEAVKQHQPPMIGGRRIKLRYAHAGGMNPPIIVVHGKQVDKIPDSYKRYLINFFQKKLKLVGTPIRVQFKGGTNPFEIVKPKKITQSEFRKERPKVIAQRKKNREG